jgi:outer membrane protein insertion porin family
MNAQFRFFWFQVEPNQDFHGLVCEGANMLPSKFLEDAFRDRHGKHVLSRSQIMFKFVNGLCALLSARPIESLELQCAGKIINIRHLDKVIKSVNGWYQERGLTGLVGNPNLCFSVT